MKRAWYVVFVGAMIAGCGVEEGAPPHTLAHQADEVVLAEHSPRITPVDEWHGVHESERSLEEIVETPWADLTPADRDKLMVISGEISPDTYRIKYPHTQLVAAPSRDAQVELDEHTEALRTRAQALAGLTPGVWNTVQLPQGRCSDGSGYKMFVMPATDPAIRASGDLIIYMEPGGACWDYPSCTGQAGVRGAANPNGIPDNFMSVSAFLDPNTPGGSPNALLSPLLYNASALGFEPNRVVTDRWNKVFLPYCTGDVHAGNRITTYTDPTGAGPDVTFYHWGAKNVEAAITYLKAHYAQPAEMLVTGCSAGGAGALVNYHFFRQQLAPFRSTMLNDSGPIFPAPGRGFQYPLHQEIRSIWNVDYVIGKLEGDIPSLNIRDDYGLVSEAIAQLHPGDRLATTLLREDYNYSIYSYARFYGLDEDRFWDEQIIRYLWDEDIDNMIAQHQRYANLYYFVPFYRSFNDSHCTTVLNWSGTQIKSSGYDVGDFIDDLLDPTRTPLNRDEGYNFGDYFVLNFPTFLVNLLL